MEICTKFCTSTIQYSIYSTIETWQTSPVQYNIPLIRGIRQTKKTKKKTSCFVCSFQLRLPTEKTFWCVRLVNSRHIGWHVMRYQWYNQLALWSNGIDSPRDQGSPMIATPSDRGSPVIAAPQRAQLCPKYVLPPGWNLSPLSDLEQVGTPLAKDRQPHTHDTLVVPSILLHLCACPCMGAHEKETASQASFFFLTDFLPVMSRHFRQKSHKLCSTVHLQRVIGFQNVSLCGFLMMGQRHQYKKTSDAPWNLANFALQAVQLNAGGGAKEGR